MELPVTLLPVHPDNLMLNKPQSGFTLIEVLITMVLLAVGLLGLAALQAKALQNNQNSYYRSQATQFAYDIADRIRANKVEAANVTSKYSMTVTDARAKSACTTTVGCSSIDMAENDFYEWSKEITDVLPIGSVSPIIYTITIQWDDDRNGAVDTTKPSESVQTRFQL
jgi:type IV pilus assembly protein PilV